MLKDPAAERNGNILLVFVYIPRWMSRIFRNVILRHVDEIKVTEHNLDRGDVLAGELGNILILRCYS